MDACPICRSVVDAPLPAGEWCAPCEAEWIVATISIDPAMHFAAYWDQLRDKVQAMVRAFATRLQPILDAVASAIRSFADAFGPWMLTGQRRPNPALAFQRRRRGHRRHGR
jgi:hypothetical protein